MDYQLEQRENPVSAKKFAKYLPRAKNFIILYY